MRFISIGLGGFFGALSRYYLGNSLTPQSTLSIPVGTLLINLLGCFILGFFFTAALGYLKVGTNLRMAIGTGFVGAFTTFSTFSLETVRLLENAQTAAAFSYIFLSTAGGFSLAYGGIILARKLSSILSPRQTAEQN